MKKCIFNKSKLCNNCGDCYVCDLNSDKKCNNCGKCIELEGYDLKAIKIDEIFYDNKELSQYEEMNKLHDEANKILNEDNELWDYIDDIKEIKSLIEEDKLQLYEEFPGLINISKKNNE
ncbi:hypothetical protein SAMN05428976_102320 [Clostridium sp. USBA 49]|jgi:K+/H+ antiporter YhaU regulatory subunit KhtT|uniref:hypothetical protein n=1 Tax=Clostridium TaxID=1485 RepID=UPI0009C6119B|nr:MULTISPECIES: hypothetical protein [Clostridium]SKA76629.1 hypothetical protein SAMN05428976_102320 [Clostridium sp. USBA 49]